VCWCQQNNLFSFADRISDLDPVLLLKTVYVILLIVGEGKGGEGRDALLGQVKRGDKGLGYLLPEIIVDSIILGQILAFRVLTSQSNFTYIHLHSTCMQLTQERP
jgi:hypothetical protein